MRDFGRILALLLAVSLPNARFRPGFSVKIDHFIDQCQIPAKCHVASLSIRLPTRPSNHLSVRRSVSPGILFLVQFYPKFLCSFRFETFHIRCSHVIKYIYHALIHWLVFISRLKMPRLCHKLYIWLLLKLCAEQNYWTQLDVFQGLNWEVRMLA